MYPGTKHQHTLGEKSTVLEARAAGSIYSRQLLRGFDNVFRVNFYGFPYLACRKKIQYVVQELRYMTPRD